MPPSGTLTNNSVKPSAAKGPATRGGADATKVGVEAIKKELETAIQVEKKAAEDARAMVEDMKIQMDTLRIQLETAQAEIRAMKLEAAKATKDVRPEAVASDLLIGQSTDSACICGSIDNIPNVERLWPNGQVLIYRFIDGHSNQHTKVSEVIMEWSHFANVTFKLIDEKTTSSSADIVISFKSDSGCWGYIGTDVLTAMDAPFTMVLGAVSDTPNLTQNDRAFILHQFGHALGLVHEHICPSETDAVALKGDLISKYYSSRDPKVVQVERYFDAYANGSVTNYSAPDLRSVMVYSMPGSFNEGNFWVEANTTLSPLDKAFMVINYPRPEMHDEAPEWTLRHALVIANVDEDTSRMIIEERDVLKRRILFANYLSSARQQNSATLVDSTPNTVLDLLLPAVQDALREFFENIDSNPEAQDIRADAELAQKLEAVLDRLASHQIVREVVQKVLPPPSPTFSSSERFDVGESFTNQLVEVVATLYTAMNPHFPASTNNSNDVRTRQVEAMTALCNELARHKTFRDAMRQAIGKDVSCVPGISARSNVPTPVSSSELALATANLEDGAEMLDVSGIVAQLSTRPAILGAVRRALMG